MSPSSSTSPVCFHCGLPLPPGNSVKEVIDGTPQDFCCIGCRAVCSAIYAAGLEGFYHRTPDGVQLAPPPEALKDLPLYDLDEVQAEFIDTYGSEREINLLVEGIHCAACVWLIERTLEPVDGVIEARVNLSGKRLKLRWDNDKLTLSSILSRLETIGYTAIPFDPEVAEGKAKKQNRALLFRMAFAGFTMMNLLWVSIALYSGASDGEFRQLFHWVGFALATPTLFYSGYPFLKSAITGLRRLHLTMDLPIAIGATTTYAYSLYVTLSQTSNGEVYYDTVVNFLFVILLGRYLEAISKRQAVDSTQRLLDLQPRGATVLKDGEETLLPIRAIKTDDIVLVKPGERIAVDGLVIAGRSSVDESMLTGESTPVVKQKGEAVCAGTTSINGALQVRVEATLKKTALGRIIHLVEDAQASKAPIQCVADRIVPWFVMTTLLLASITFAWWFGTDVELALMAATSVLIITCPCAFGLATPMAIAVASGAGAREGILVKNGGVLETLSHITHVVFDKTGTLTEGHMRVQEVYVTGGMTANELLNMAAAVERFSEHGVARAIVEESRVDTEIGTNISANIDINPGKNTAQDFLAQPGFGVSGVVNKHSVLVGTQAWLGKHNVIVSDDISQQVTHWEQQGTSCVYIAVDGNALGMIAVADQLRVDAKALVNQLRSMGIKMTLLSGDRQTVTQSIAEQLGGMDVIAEVLPQDKDQVIRRLQEEGEKVVMVGDGINDAPALIRADVGIALGSGTDVSAESADIILISNELEKVRAAMQLSRRTLNTIRQNIAISISYNIIMVPLAMMTLITPLVAAISMPISSLLVIGNAARIRQMFRSGSAKKLSKVPVPVTQTTNDDVQSENS